jgi:peptidoglycan hydrolase CwlO-like protein
MPIYEIITYVKAMADSTKPINKEADRRTFLKIGTGVVAGAAIATVAGVVYYDSVISGNNNSSSSTVSSLQGQVSSLNNQLTSTQAQLNSANSQLSGVSTQLSSTQQALTSANGQITSLTSQVSSLNSAVTSANSQVSTLTGQVNTLQSNLDSDAVFLVLNTNEQTELKAIVSAIIPTDSTGPGATEAGCAYFIDHQLKGLYGNDGNCYVGGPYIQANTQTPVTYGGVTYNGATVTYNVAGTTYTVKYPPTGNVRVGAGTRYQYPWNKREFWRLALAGIQTYANAAYGGNFETLSATNQTAVLTDMWNNKPTAAQFSGILPSDFAYELFFLTWAGFGMDPVYGGNRGMVGWTYTGFNGVNQGNFYNEGMTTKQIMVNTSPITLKPASLGQYQKGSP